MPKFYVLWEAAYVALVARGPMWQPIHAHKAYPSCKQHLLYGTHIKRKPLGHWARIHYVLDTESLGFGLILCTIATCVSRVHWKPGPTPITSVTSRLFKIQKVRVNTFSGRVRATIGLNNFRCCFSLITVFSPLSVHLYPIFLLHALGNVLLNLAMYVGVVSGELSY